MSSVRRVYVEKKPEFAVQAKALRHEIRHYLGIWGVTGEMCIRDSAVFALITSQDTLNRQAVEEQAKMYRVLSLIHI